jgi:hypothetical protein
MKETLVSFETAKLAKEKGFDLKTHNYFTKHPYDKIYHVYNGYDDEYWGDNYEYDWNTNGEPFKPFSNDCYSIPTQALLQKWLREVHGINIFMLFKPNIKKWDFIPYRLDLNGHEYVNKYSEYFKDNNNRRFGTYEEALEKGLVEALKLI